MPRFIYQWLMACAVIVSLPYTCHGQFRNGSFETGDFSGWTVRDVNPAYRSSQVVGAGTTDNAFPSFATAPTDGDFAAIHGFDGSPGTIRISQEVFISGDHLSFDYRGGWDMVPYGASQSRTFIVNVESLRSGDNLASHTILTANPGTNVNDTGSQTETIDVSGFFGKRVRVSFDWMIPESFTGPGLFQLDNVQMNVLLDQYFGQLEGTAAQTNIQTQSFQLSSLSRRVNTFARGLDGFSSAGMYSSSSRHHELNDVELVSYNDASGNARRQSVLRSRQAQSPLYGWVTGYGIGGNVQGKNAVAGLDYQNGGTQIGIFKALNDQTLVGAFGGYGHQSIDTVTAQSLDSDGGQVGGFVHRRDSTRSYYFLAGNVGFDDYKTNRQTPVGVANGNYDGMQTGLYVERGWNRKSPWGSWNPDVALQHVWVEQDAHTELGPLGTSINQVEAHSLRQYVGGRFYGRPSDFHSGYLTKFSHIHWMHEYLDTATPVTANVLGSNFTASGLDLGQNWAMLGTGLNYHRGIVDLYANYDLQFNDRQTFHIGSGGMQIAW